MRGSSEMKNEQGARRRDRGARPQLAMAWRILRGARAGLVAGGLLLPGLALAAGQDASRPGQAAARAATPSQGVAPDKVSPYIKASRERALAPRPEHQTKLQLAVRGTQKAGNR
jgi:hypothetical protein